MCTSFTLKAEDKSIVVGRAMDFSSPMEPFFIIRKRGSSIEESLNYIDNTEVHTNKSSTYGYIAIAVNDIIPNISKFVATDGMNEVGLSAGFHFMKGSSYPHFDKEKIERNLFLPFLCSWVLAYCASVDEVKEKLSNRNVWYFSNQNLIDKIPVYITISDRSGKTANIEFLDNKMNIVDNPIGVSTNEPPLDWHLTNLKRYLSLSNYAPESMKIDELHCSPFGHSGLKGLPGDTSSPSRFLRTAFVKHFSIVPKDSQEAFNHAVHMLNILDAPAGLSRYPDGSMVFPRWSVIKGLTSMQFALRTYNNHSFIAIDLSKIDFGKVKTKIFAAPKKSNFYYIDDSGIPLTKDA